MKILISPEDIIKRGCWDSYVYYIVGSDKDAQEILKENKEFEISERDALIIGLLKVLETENLIHRFNNYIYELLVNKSSKHEDLLIRKKTLDSAIDNFLEKFPDYWEPSKMWVISLKELVNYISEIKEKIEDLEVHTIVDKNMTYEYYNSNQVKKMLKFHY
jgi:KaiC/GvpD/RAD55 family RecA-like ATPase